MRVTPIKQYESPSFPTRSILDERPELLLYIPRRWRTNPAVIAALTSMCALMVGYRSLADGDQGKPVESRVAPIFQHGGGGRAYYGCVSVNAPVFLTDADAEAVIREEGERAGIHFEKHVWVLKNVTLSLSKPGAAGDASESKERVVDLHLDGSDKSRAISYEYISETDSGVWGTGSGDTYGTAVVLRDSLAKLSPKGTYGVFYAPSAESEVAGKRVSATATTREQLRAQVQDFIKWLKAQGVI